MTSKTGEESSRSLRQRYASFDDRWYSTPIKAVVGFGFIALLPFMLDVSVFGVSLSDWFSLELFIITLLFAMTAQAWNMMTGYTGYFSFGHATFFGTGAYITQKLVIDYTINPWFGMVVAALFATLVGLFIGYLTFRYELRGHYFALATLAFAMMFQALARNMGEFGGSRGLYKPFADEYAAGPGLVAFQWRELMPYFYLILVFLIVTTTVAWVIKRSSIGIYMFAIKEDEDAAQSLGIPVFRYKLFGIGISAFFTACAGAYWSMYFNTINPRTVFHIERNVEILLPAVFGGMGTVIGPIIGAFAVLPLSEVIRQLAGNIESLDRIVYGLAIIFIVIYSPRGIVHWPARYQDFRQWVANTYGIGSPSKQDDNETAGQVDQRQPDIGSGSGDDNE